MKFHRLIALGILAVTTLTSAHALDLRFINWDGDEGALKFDSKNQTTTIHASESSLSSIYTYDGAGPLVLFKEVVVDGKTVRKTAATLTPPAGLTHAIVILAATDETKNTYLGMWIDDAPETRTAGTIKLVNLSTHAVTFNIDGSTFNLAPSATHQLAVRSNVRRILMQAATQVDGQWNVVANNPLPVRDGLRVLVLLRNGRPQDGAKTNIVDLLSFYDLPPPLPKPAAAANH